MEEFPGSTTLYSSSKSVTRKEEQHNGNNNNNSRKTRFSDDFKDNQPTRGSSSEDRLSKENHFTNGRTLNRSSLANRLSENVPTGRKDFKRSSLANRLSTKHSIVHQKENTKKRGIAAIRASLAYHFSGEEKDLKLYLLIGVLPCLISVWYSVAMLFPPQARQDYKFFLWDDGKLLYDDDGRPIICPRSSICSEGILQVVLISVARVTAFASYAFMGITFLSKMHFTIHRLSTSYLRTFVPFESLHNFHTNSGKIFASLAVLHTISHYIRYIVRQDVDQLTTRVHISGLCGALSMITVVLCMTSVFKRFKDSIGRFEKRLSCHWLFIILCIALCFHHERTRVIILTFFGLWCLDYTYGLVFATYSLEVVELLPLPGESGVQMLFRNPPGFNPKSGEYVKIQLPWLTHGGEEWHPFSVYLRESTKRGLKSVYNQQSNWNLNLNDEDDGENGGHTLESFIRLVLISDFESEAIDAPSSLFIEEAREDLTHSDRYPTTQVFMNPVGDWTKGLVKDVTEQKQLRACWVRGPYTSPYHVAREFSHLILTASGIGITPALGVMGQYAGYSRTKILIWSTRDANMLKFFAPLIKDAHLAVVFYTGKTKLSTEELQRISSHGNIYIQQSRPKSLPGVIDAVIVQFENFLNLSTVKTLTEIEKRNKAAWCVLYCGGSVRIRDELSTFTKKNEVTFEYEMFDW